MQITFNEILANLLSVSPFVGLLGFLFWKEREDRKEKERQLIEKEKEKDQLVKEKDGVYEKILTSFQENTKINAEVKSSLEKNAQATNTLTQTIHEVLTRR